MSDADRHPFISTFLVLFLGDGVVGLVVGVAHLTSRSLFDPDRLLPVMGPFGLALLMGAMVQVTLAFSRNMRWSARWIGLFVTFLNLIPVGQLDGGHVSYALFGHFHRWPARAFLVVIALLGFQGWPGWFMWTLLLLFLGIQHPPTVDRTTSLDPLRRVAAWATVGLFIVTFIPVPFSTTEAPPPLPLFDAPATPIDFGWPDFLRAPPLATPV